jgi:hypothetical protein
VKTASAPPRPWDRQTLVKEMVSLPKSKRLYLLRMLERMEKELRSAQVGAPRELLTVLCSCICDTPEFNAS